jgi:putative transposase
MRVLPGRVTMLGIARWAGPGGSDRPVPRWFSQALPWARLWWVVCRPHGHRPDEVYLLAGDAVVGTKAGTHTSGLERFCSRLYGKPIPGIAFWAFALVRVQARRAVPVRVAPVVRREAEQVASTANAAKRPQASTPSRRPGRPQGRRNTPPADAPRPPAWSRLTARLEAWLQLIAGILPWTDVGLDGHCGHHQALQRARQRHLHLLAKRRGDAALDGRDTGPDGGRGPHRQYGSNGDDGHMPATSLTEPTGEERSQTCGDQAPLRHNAFAPPCRWSSSPR